MQSAVCILYVTVYEKTRHVGYFAKIAIAQQVINLPAKQAVLQIWKQLPVQFLSYAFVHDCPNHQNREITFQTRCCIYGQSFRILEINSIIRISQRLQQFVLQLKNFVESPFGLQYERKRKKATNLLKTKTIRRYPELFNVIIQLVYLAMPSVV